MGASHRPAGRRTLSPLQELEPLAQRIGEDLRQRVMG
jgi:hypothetical protein